MQQQSEENAGVETESNETGRRRRTLQKLVQRFADELSEDERVQGIIVVGSLATGRVDHVSDIDMSVYLSESFTTDEFEKWKDRAIASGGALYGGNAEEGFALWQIIDGVKVDTGWATLEKIVTETKKAREESSIEGVDHLILDGISRSMILFDRQGEVKRLVEDICTVPDEMGRKMIESHLRLIPLWILRDMSAGRGEIVWHKELLLQLIERFLWILCGLNRRYYPGKLKGFAHVVDPLPIAPHNFRRRAENLLSVTPAESIPNIEQLAFELYDLVDHHEPEIDTTSAKEWLSTTAGSG